ncbi:predicted protein [Phaeodactylum tricornutum CCAP 1055/1]|jgi:hypothetical protein|uniref:Uncharacterized protein n=1 Tax=Phaeodactylum tricornutum (strain CCAP 1055/1) TaxID=556484 RepID=B7GDI0_PHATC|nr:predicted protein [Phaeodactylum tricornutum CCAP 1055/1]EEC43266.1 predicted protein [Phaeodactylum tricornutum CCAP 1055/1]|eukprot:XP_002185134.1 predicted protein [Phaeodactylum tricornutum CCAP 1055/1]
MSFLQINAPVRTLAIATSALVLVTSGSMAYKALAEYGWKGILNIIWEGDPFPNLRIHLNILRDIEASFEQEIHAIASLEEALERARLDSVDSGDKALVVRLWQSNIPQTDLRKKLAFLSDTLDKLAFKVDQVPAEIKCNIRQRKKKLSLQAVDLMERTDTLINLFKQAASE